MRTRAGYSEGGSQYGCSTPNEVQAHPWNAVTDRTLVLDMMLTSTCEQPYLQATYDAAAGGVLDAPLASLATDWNKVSITIRGIRDDTVNPDVKLSSILLKAKVMAYSLDVPEFKQWIERELEGQAMD